jgi:hypothetical protein
MSDEGFNRTRLRIGKWLPPYDAAGWQAAPQPVSEPPPDDGPADTAPTAPVIPEPVVETPGTQTRRRSRRRILLAGVTTLTVLVLVGVASGHRGSVEPTTPDKPSSPEALGSAQEHPASSASYEAGPSTSPTAETTRRDPNGTAGSVETGHSTPAKSAGNGTGAASTTRSPSDAGTSAADLPLTVGTRVGLAPVTKPGYQVRHRDFVGRIDLIGPGSSALEKADSTFTVRSGLADSRCVSFEAINYPGYYLRHQNFQLYLQRVDGTRLFANDATFCAVTGLTGQHTSLRSLNYPSRYLRHRDSQLYIDPVDSDNATRAAMTFAVQAAL